MKKNKFESGFTLVEVLVASVVIVFLGMAILGLQYVLGQSQVFIWKSSVDVDQANSSMQSLIKEIRTARPSDSGAYSLELVSDNEIIFYSDIDFDGESEKIRYFLTDNVLSKGVIEPTGFPPTYPEENEKVKVLTENVRNGDEPMFYYYNGDWPADTQNNPLPSENRLSNTRSVGILLKLNADADKPEKDYIAESYVQIRMLKENL